MNAGRVWCARAPRRPWGQRHCLENGRTASDALFEAHPAGKSLVAGAAATRRSLSVRPPLASAFAVSTAIATAFSSSLISFLKPCPLWCHRHKERWLQVFPCGCEFSTCTCLVSANGKKGTTTAKAELTSLPSTSKWPGYRRSSFQRRSRSCTTRIRFLFP